MGRRSRARQRAATAVAAGAEPAAQTTPRPGRRRPGWLRLLNPFKFRRLTSARARSGAIGFGLSAVLFAGLGWLTGEVAWFSSAVLLAVLALAWGAAAALMGRLDRPS
jgi:hypothetical protein